MSGGLSDQSRALLQELVKSPSHRAQIAELQGEDAQCIANFLSVLLHEDGAFASEEGRRLFRLLRRLVKSSEMLPQCYKLQGLRCNFSHAREGGSFADIFEGEYRKRKVCVKAVRIFEKDDNAKMLQAIAKEAVLWAHLFHGNILPFYGVYIPKESGRICIISPWMSRGDLSSHLRNYPDTPRLPLILDVISGLRYLHASSIVHGDLKAKNVLISDNGRALIADFGISYLPVSTNLVSTRLSNGSMRWMAPELLTEECPPTLPSDVWSFGCVCYEVFTCKLPFYDHANDIQIFSALVNRTRRPGDVNELNNISVKERELMNKCWNYEPESRPSCEGVYQSVVNLVGGCNSAKLEDVALWNTVRGDSTMTVDHMRAHRILSWIRAHGHLDYSSPSTHPVPTKPSLAPNFSHNLTYNSSGRSQPPSEPQSTFPAPGLSSIEYDPQQNTPRPVNERRKFARFLSFLTPRLSWLRQSRYTDSTNQPQQSRPHPPQLRSSRSQLSSAVTKHSKEPPHDLLQQYADHVSFRHPAHAQNYRPPVLGPGNAVPRNTVRPYYAGRRKALCVGISYFGRANELEGSVDHARAMRHFLCDFFDYSTEDVVILTDDNPQSSHQPTRENIIQTMRWLVKDTWPGDSLFLYYSGHSRRSQNRGGDGLYGNAEAIYPMDFRQSGYIVADLMRDILVASLPEGCRFTAVFDSCHSGSALGLPYVYRRETEGVKFGMYARRTRSSPANVIVWSVYTDSQAGANTPGAIHATGALASAFMAALKEKRDQSYEEMLKNTCNMLQGQELQFSSSYKMNTSAMFIC